MHAVRISFECIFELYFNFHRFIVRHRIIIIITVIIINILNLLCIIKHTNRERIFFFSLVSSEQIIIVKGNDWALEG